MKRNMAPANRAVVGVALSLFYLFRAIFSSEYFSPVTLFNNELSKQRCSPLSEWEEYASECGKVPLYCYFATSSRRSRCGVTRLALPLQANLKGLITASGDSPEEITRISSFSDHCGGENGFEAELTTRGNDINHETTFCNPTGYL